MTISTPGSSVQRLLFRLKEDAKGAAARTLEVLDGVLAAPRAAVAQAGAHLVAVVHELAHPAAGAERQAAAQTEPEPKMGQTEQAERAEQEHGAGAGADGAG